MDLPEKRKRTDIASARVRRDGIDGVSLIEIEPGRSVPNNWDDALFEPWAVRKARRAEERRAA
jgi:hypothetical protein